jgi:hypothetical protein
MRLEQIVPIVALLIVIGICAIPSVQADTTIVMEDGTVSVPGGDHAVIKKFRTQADGQSTITYLMGKNDTSDADQYRVLVLDQDNYEKYRAGGTYVAHDDVQSLLGIAASLVSFVGEDTYYLVLDNSEHTEHLVVNYGITYRNVEFVEDDAGSWWWVALIVTAAIVVLIVVLLYGRKSEKPPVHPNPPDK